MSAPETIKAVGKVVISLVLLLTPPGLLVAGIDPGPSWVATGAVIGWWFPKGKA